MTERSNRSDAHHNGETGQTLNFQEYKYGVMKVIASIVFSLVLLFVFGCGDNSSSSPRPQSSTGRVYDQATMTANVAFMKNAKPEYNSEAPYLGYAQVSSAWIDGFYGRYRNDLKSNNVHYDVHFDCVYYSILCIGDAGAEFLADEPTSKLSAQGLAMFLVEYVPDNFNTPINVSHAIVLFLTEKGPVFFDPQVGVVTLDQKEVRSVYKIEAF